MTIQRLSFHQQPTLIPKDVHTFEKVLEAVMMLGLSDRIVEKLKVKLKKMPPGAYGHFLLNINHHIDKVGEEDGKPSNTI